MKNQKYFQSWVHRKSGNVSPKKVNKLCMLLVLVLFVSIFTAGCKQSPTLQEVRYTNDASLVDTDISQLDPEDWGQLNEQFENERNDDVDSDRDTEDELGSDNDDEEKSDSASDIQYRSDEISDLQGSKSSQTSTDNGGDTSKNSGDNQGSGMSPDYVAGDPNSSKQIVDASGRTVTVPENVGSVAAVGAAAQMVEMLGGSGKLMAADSELLASSLARTAFADASSVKQWWSGNGSDGISAANFSSLLAAKPDVCLELSGSNTFTSAQVSQLEAAGIAYVVLPALSSQDNLKHAVALVGQMLGGDAESKASEYSSWVDSTVKTVGSKVSGGLVSLYVTEWDSDAKYTLDTPLTILGGTNSGSGLAIAYSPAASQLVSTFMSAAGVTNESTRAKNSHKITDYVYVTPSFRFLNAEVSGSKATYYSGEGEYGSLYDLFVATEVGTSYKRLGSSTYPAIVAASNEVKSNLENNWFWKFKEFTSDGLLKENVAVGDRNMPVNKSIDAEYNIYVNPQGMVSWADGSVESPLESYWVAAKFYDAYSMSEVKNQTKEFYQKFFGCTLSDAQLTAIFGE